MLKIQIILFPLIKILLGNNEGKGKKEIARAYHFPDTIRFWAKCLLIFFFIMILYNDKISGEIWIKLIYIRYNLT